MRTLAELEAMLDGIRDAPAETGVVELIVRRPAVDEREVVSEVPAGRHRGCRRRLLAGPRKRPPRPIDPRTPEAQITVMNARAAAAIAGDVSQ